MVSSLSESDFQAVADFSKLSEVDAVPIDVETKKYANQLEITLGNINTMKIKKDEMISVSVPVNIVTDGEVAEGYAVGSMTGTPNLVKVTGPENLLSNAKEIVAEVDIDKISQDITTTVKPILQDGEGNVIDSTQIELDTNSIDVSIQLWKKKEVKVELESTGEPASGFKLLSFDYEPKQITVAAPDEVLEELDSIELPSISLDGLTENYEKDIDITQALLPDQVVLADDTEDVKAKASIEKVITRKMTFTSKDITVKGNQGFSITYDSANRYYITIEGVKSVVNDLKVTEFEPWIDVTDLEAGEHELALHVKEVDGVTVSSTVSIKLTLKDD